MPARRPERGATLGSALELAANLDRKTPVPLVFMSYVNPLLAYGFERFVVDGVASGVDGIIVPDIPWRASGV